MTGHIDDTQCGFKGFRRDVARDLFSRLRITSIVFDVDMIYLARRRRLPDGGRAGHVGGQARLPDARSPGPRAAGSLGSASDQVHPQGRQARFVRGDGSRKPAGVPLSRPNLKAGAEASRVARKVRPAPDAGFQPPTGSPTPGVGRHCGVVVLFSGCDHPLFI